MTRKNENLGRSRNNKNKPWRKEQTLGNMESLLKNLEWRHMKIAGTKDIYENKAERDDISEVERPPLPSFIPCRVHQKKNINKISLNK